MSPRALAPHLAWGILIAVLAGTADRSLAQAPEMRAMWVSRFEWPSTNQATAQATLDNIMQTLAANNFNAVFLQIRGQADVLYPSPSEVWSPIIGGSDPGWDPLQYAIDAAHANGLEFHAYINTHTCWQSGSHSPPANPNHLYFDHCDASNPSARDWLIHDVSGTPIQYHENDYVWLAPGVPDYQAYIRQQVLYVVENYDVDGIHFDRIRTPNSSFSYDPISQARRSSAQSNPNGLSFSLWTRDQITRNVRDIYAEIMSVKPWVKVSAAVFPDSTTAPANQHQEALVWAQTGGMDILVPMIYSSGGAGTTWDTRLQGWLNGTSRHVVAGQITSVGCSMLLTQIDLARTRGADGNNVFSWSSFTCFNDYQTNVYEVPVSTPAMSWKDNPTLGIIHGYVTDSSNAQPVVDAQIVYSGSVYKALSTGDGYYSLLRIQPGTFTVTASHPGHGTLVIPNVVVAAGDVVRQDNAFGTLIAPIIEEVTPDPDSGVMDQPYSRQLTLSQGSADTWTLLDGPAGAVVDANGNVSGWTPGSGDVGLTISLTARATNGAGSDDETWGVLVSAVAPCFPSKITGFEGYAPGTRVLFNLPRFSGSTSGDLALIPDAAQVTNAVAFTGTQSEQVQWQFLDTDPQRWLRLTTFNATNVPNPTVELDRPIRVRIRVDAGRFRLALGIRETATTAEVGQNGGTTGSIEWVGAGSDINGAPQGVLVESMPGVWQTFIFDPLTEPIHSFTGDGVLATLTNKGVLEHLAFSVVDTVGPATVYIDDIDHLCALPEYGDLDLDGDVDLSDWDLYDECLGGPGVAAIGECLDADADGDSDVDLEDWAVFQDVFMGNF